jgi:hypothetical protein
MEVDKIMRALLTLGANWSTPRRHGSGQNNEYITNTRGKLPCLRGVLEFARSVSNVLIFCPLPSLRGVLELAPIVSSDLIIFSPLPYLREVLTLGANSSTPRRHGSGQNNENITNTRGQLEHSTKTWK